MFLKNIYTKKCTHKCNQNYCQELNKQRNCLYSWLKNLRWIIFTVLKTSNHNALIRRRLGKICLFFAKAINRQRTTRLHCAFFSHVAFWRFKTFNASDGSNTIRSIALYANNNTNFLFFCPKIFWYNFRNSDTKKIMLSESKSVSISWRFKPLFLNK